MEGIKGEATGRPQLIWPCLIKSEWRSGGGWWRGRGRGRGRLVGRTMGDTLRQSEGRAAETSCQLCSAAE